MDSVHLKNEIINFLAYQRKPKDINQIKNYNKKILFSDIRAGNLNGRPVKRICILLESKGCGWLLKNNHYSLVGCTICSYPLKTTLGGNLHENKISSSFLKEYSKYNYENYPIICLYNSGSFLNNEEIPESVQFKILEEVFKNKDIEQIVIESRVEYIDEEKLERIHRKIGDKELIIGVGLESNNDFIRNVCINKGLSRKKYERAIKSINKYFKSLTYVLLKPPFTNEITAIIDSINSIKYAFDKGSDIVSLEVCNIQELSLPYYLYRMKHYRPPWLWSIIEVLNKCYKGGQIIIGGFQINPMPKYVAHNCGNCDLRILNLINKYNSTLDINIFDKVDCNCKILWKKMLNDDIYSNNMIKKKIDEWLCSMNHNSK